MLLAKGKCFFWDQQAGVAVRQLLGVFPQQHLHLAQLHVLPQRQRLVQLRQQAVLVVLSKQSMASVVARDG